MLFLAGTCETLAPVIRLIKLGVIPLIQAVIIVALIVLLIIDFGKAVMAGKEDEIKSAQKLAIKRVIYAVVVFLVPWIVNVAFGLLTNTRDTQAIGEKEDAISCYANCTRKSCY